MSVEHLIEQLKASIKQATYISIDGGKSFVKVYHVDDQRLDEHEDTQTGIDYEEEDGYTGSYYFSQVAQACRRGQLQIKKLVDVEVPRFEEKHIDVDEWLCEVVTRAPHVYATTSETKALIKKNKEHYAVVSIPKPVNLSPMAGNSIQYFSSSAAMSFPDKTVRLIELADAKELNSNYVLDFDKYDFFIAECIGKQ